MKKIVILVVVLMMAGCASKNYLQKHSIIVADKPYTYVFGESCNHTGIHLKVVDRYNENGELMARDCGVGEGIMQKVIPAAVGGGLAAGGMIGAAALLRPDETNVVQTGGGASATAVSSAVAKQKQGQVQMQNQKQRQDSVNVNTNLNPVNVKVDNKVDNKVNNSNWNQNNNSNKNNAEVEFEKTYNNYYKNHYNIHNKK
jgi:gas vesicle protein